MNATFQRGGEGEPMVLIHGFSATPAVWQPLLETLERNHDVVAVTLAGHVGGQEVPAETASLTVLVDAVERDMDDAGFDTAHLVGNSLGGWIALELARRGRARSVVAIAPAGGWEAGTRDERRLRNLFRRSHRLASALAPHADSVLRRPRLRRLLLSQGVARGELIPPATAAAMVRDSVECPIYFPLMDAILRDGPPASFSGISCPVLLAWGTRDRILPAPRYSARLRNMIPAAEWLEFAGLGHMPMSDDRELVARTIIDFTTKAGKPATAPTAA
jgi:pimeloyl-ACP methyl ester carboxylesterase